MTLPETEATKKCPFCAETIKAEAIVCRYCGRDLVPQVTPAPAQTSNAPIFEHQYGFLKYTIYQNRVVIEKLFPPNRKEIPIHLITEVKRPFAKHLQVRTIEGISYEIILLPKESKEFQKKLSALI